MFRSKISQPIPTLNRKYGLDNKEIAFIETHVKEMK